MVFHADSMSAQKRVSSIACLLQRTALSAAPGE
jgi:hypothetical protein